MSLFSNLPNDLIIRIVKEDQINSIKKSVIDELNDLFDRCDSFCKHQIEHDTFNEYGEDEEWDGVRGVGMSDQSGDWDYFLWAALDFTGEYRETLIKGKPQPLKMISMTKYNYTLADHNLTKIWEDNEMSSDSED